MLCIGMRPIRAAAFLLLSAHSPALAGSAATPAAGAVHILCESPERMALCRALGVALARRYPALAVSVDDTPGAPGAGLLVLRFVATRERPSLLAGHLTWRHAGDGAEGRGPEIELTVLDSTIADHLFDDYAHQLVTLTPLPL